MDVVYRGIATAPRSCLPSRSATHLVGEQQGRALHSKKINFFRFLLNFNPSVGRYGAKHIGVGTSASCAGGWHDMFERIEFTHSTCLHHRRDE